MKCFLCGSELTSGDMDCICYRCRIKTNIDQVIYVCPKCKYENNPELIVCPKCGHALPKEREVLK